MIRRAVMLGLSIALVPIISSCSRKAENKHTGEYSPAVLSDDAVPVITVRPTRPAGGEVEGKGQSLDPEVAEKRRNANIIQPIVFGKSVANINMFTKKSEAYNTLVFAQDLGGVERFAEHILIVWDDGADPVPFLVGIEEGYAGTISLPAPYGTVTIGQKMANVISNAAEVKTFMLNVGATFENQPSNYDCEKALTCQYRESADAYILDFKRGGIRLAKSEGLPLSFMYFSQAQVFYPRATDPIVYGISIAGMTFFTKRANFEAKYGPPTASNDLGYLFYDQTSVGVLWGGGNTPLSMEAVGTYQGALNFGATIGNRKINDSFNSYAATNADLIKLIYRGLHTVADPNYDCLAQATPTCVLTVVDGGFIQMQFGRNALLFVNNDAKTWIQYLVDAP